jgi:plastocyanin
MLTAGSIAGKVTVSGARDNGDVLVYIASAPGQFPPQQPARLDQSSLMFRPHVLPIVVGTTVNFHNGDDVQHNVFTPSAAGDSFNLGTWPKGQSHSYTFTKMGKVELLCNVHHEMRGYILVLQNPFFAVTDKEGNFRIDGLPAGSYQLKVWHERGGAPAKPVQVSTGVLTANFELAVH